jgi:hypothetical protein
MYWEIRHRKAVLAGRSRRNVALELEMNLELWITVMVDHFPQPHESLFFFKVPSRDNLNAKVGHCFLHYAELLNSIKAVKEMSKKFTMQ